MDAIKSRFCEGDRVVWDKQPDKTWHVHFRFSEEYVNIINRNKSGFTSVRVHVDEIKHVNRKEQLKQAIREVLLSDEFLAAFAKAFINAPMPSSIQPDMFTTSSGWITKDDIQWLNSEDLVIAPINGSDS